VANRRTISVTGFNADVFIVKERTIKRNNKVYIDRCKYFQCHCIGCGKDRGYQTLSRIKNKPQCVKCSTNTTVHKEKLKQNHWSKTGIYVTPKQYVTEQQILEKRQRELANNRKFYRTYYQENWQRIHEKRKQYLNNNIQCKLAKNLRTRLYVAIRYRYKAGSAVRDLGCSIEELKAYLESKFQPGMTWENYGRHGWHIDHIEPLFNFDLLDRDQIIRACNYTNLQPLWAIDNLIKGYRFIGQQ